ncbi:MAG: hypothetical protein WA322_03855 [Pseudolabrys sp.]
MRNALKSFGKPPAQKAGRAGLSCKTTGMTGREKISDAIVQGLTPKMNASFLGGNPSLTRFAIST